MATALGGCYAVARSAGHYGLATAADRIVFVVDVSGSVEGRQEGTVADRARGEAAARAGNAVARQVGGVAGRVLGGQVRRESTKLGGAKRELIPALRGLPAGAQFGLVTFGDAVRPWRDALVPATEGHRTTAALYVNGLAAEGSTPMRAALERAFRFGATTVVVVTDGIPDDGSPDDIRQTVRRLNADRRVTVHTVGLGGDQDAAFLAALARDNGGRFVQRP